MVYGCFGGFELRALLRARAHAHASLAYYRYKVVVYSPFFFRGILEQRIFVWNRATQKNGRLIILSCQGIGGLNDRAIVN